MLQNHRYCITPEHTPVLGNWTFKYSRVFYSPPPQSVPPGSSCYYNKSATEVTFFLVVFHNLCSCLLLPPIAFHGHQSTQWGPEQKLPSVNSKSQEAKATTSLLLLNLGTLSASTPIHHHIMRVVLQTKLSEIFRYEIVKTLFILPPLSNRHRYKWTIGKGESGVLLNGHMRT